MSSFLGMLPLRLRPRTVPPRLLVLFDIDGTILHGRPIWKESFTKAVGIHFPQFHFETVSFEGKTDLQICHELLEQAGYKQDRLKVEMVQILETYFQLVSQRLQKEADTADYGPAAVLLPGMAPLLSDLKQREEVLMGLLTGNVMGGARSKLKCVGLSLDDFEVGIFGDDHWDRYKLPTLITSYLLREHDLHFEGKAIVIIGDTVHDVNCGKSLGVKSIAVGTGTGVDQLQLQAQKPDHYFKDCSSWQKVLAAILN